MTDTPRRGVASEGLWRSMCKDCEAERRFAQSKRHNARDADHLNRLDNALTDFSYSSRWVERILDRGNSRSDRCERHRKAHKQAITAIEVPYVSLQVISDVVDPTNPTGPLGGLGPLPVEHQRSEVNVDLDRFEFGMEDSHILELLEGLRRCQVAVVEAGTGTGKSTFMPFRLMRPPASAVSLSKFGPIVVTEPRVAAAKGVAHFVGEELCMSHDSRTCSSHVGPGFSVGYQVKGEKVWDSACELIYVTDGTMINWLRDGQLARIGAVIIDEAHERSENIDIILALLRDRIRQFKHLRVIITSATLDRNFFVEYFGGEKHVFSLNVPSIKSFGYGVPLFPDLRISDHILKHGMSISGQLGSKYDFQGWAAHGPDQVGYPTEDLHETTRLLATLRCIDEIPPADWKEKMPSAVAKQVAAIARGTEWGDILAFLPTSKSINDAVAEICTYLEQDRVLSRFDVYPLLSSTTKETTTKAIGARQRGDKRKIVVSSNLAETSLTVKGIRYVVDSGLICQQEWDPDIASGSYPTKLHSQSAVRQRWGRVGRDAPGWVFPLYTTTQFMELPLNTPPGSTQTSLESFFLKLIAAGLDVNKAELPVSFRHDSFSYDTESEKTIDVFVRECQRARNALQLAGAIDSRNHLTDYGREIERFPGEGSEALALILAEHLACVHEVALALNVLGNSRLFGKNESILGIDLSWPLAWRVEALQRHRALAIGCRDDLDLLLRVCYLWQSASEPFKWCSTWWINEDALQEAWSGAMDSVRNLSAAMRGKADRNVSPELGERARAVLTRAMVGIRYTRIDGATFRAIDTTSSEPQTAQLGRGELVEPGNNVLAFGRYRNHAEDNVESTVYISHVVQISDWALSNDLATAGLDLIVKCSQRRRDKEHKPLDPLSAVREEVPIGSIIKVELRTTSNGIQEVNDNHLQIISQPRSRPKARVRSENEGKQVFFDRDWDPLGVVLADTPDEESNNRILDPRELEINDPVDIFSSSSSTVIEFSPDSNLTTTFPFIVKSAYTSYTSPSSITGRVAAYDLAKDGRIGLIIEPLVTDLRDAYDNTDLEFGQELEVAFLGIVHHANRDYFQFMRLDLRGYLFIDSYEVALNYYDRSLAERLSFGAKFAAVVIPDKHGLKGITILPDLRRNLDAYKCETINNYGKPQLCYPATVTGFGKYNLVIVELDQQGERIELLHRFKVKQHKFHGPLSERAVPGQQVLVALEAEFGEKLDLRNAPLALTFAKSHPHAFNVDSQYITLRTTSVSPELMRQLAATSPSNQWQHTVWRFYADSLRCSVKSVHARSIIKVLECPASIISLARVRTTDLKRFFGVDFEVDASTVSIIGLDSATVGKAAEAFQALAVKPRLIAKLPSGKAGLVIGRGHKNRIRLESLPGMQWVWVEGDTIGMVAESDSALIVALRDVRNSVESEVCELNVPQDKRGLLIGKEAATINQIKQSSGCKVKFPNRDRGESHFTIECPNEFALQKFLQLVEQKVGPIDVSRTSLGLKIIEDTRTLKDRESSPSFAASKTVSKVKPSSQQQKIDESSGCFIATACYGDSDHPDVLALRHLRDTSLSHSQVGRFFIRFYCVISPSIAQFLNCNKAAASFVRMAISPVVKMAYDRRSSKH